MERPRTLVTIFLVESEIDRYRVAIITTFCSEMKLERVNFNFIIQYLKIVSELYNLFENFVKCKTRL